MLAWYSMISSSRTSRPGTDLVLVAGAFSGRDPADQVR